MVRRFIHTVQSLVPCILAFTGFGCGTTSPSYRPLPQASIRWISNSAVKSLMAHPDSVAPVFDTVSITHTYGKMSESYRTKGKDSTVLSDAFVSEPESISFALVNGMPAEEIESRAIEIRFDGKPWAMIELASDVRLPFGGPWNFHSSDPATMPSKSGVFTARLIITDTHGIGWASPETRQSITVTHTNQVLWGGYSIP